MVMTMTPRMLRSVKSLKCKPTISKFITRDKSEAYHCNPNDIEREEMVGQRVHREEMTRILGTVALKTGVGTRYIRYQSLEQTIR